MEVTTRMKYLSFIILGVMFIITGFALNEPSILAQVNPSNIDKWYKFLAPWVGESGKGGLPVPW